MPSALEINELSHCYGERRALDQISLEIPQGCILAMLGPNGSGKTTLFRILATLLPVQSGSAMVAGLDLKSQGPALRRRLGVVFQNPSLDPKLRVAENLKFHGWMYGMQGAALRQRIEELLQRFGLAERARERVDTLSGGLQRRVELARALLHDPEILLLDEPSTGLDPSARINFWTLIHEIRKQDRKTIAFTTHLFDEAERCEKLAILDEGRLAAWGSPDELKAALGGSVISIRSSKGDELEDAIREKFSLPVKRIDDQLRIKSADPELAGRLLKEFDGQIDSITAGKIGLEDVYIEKTGHQFKQETA